MPPVKPLGCKAYSHIPHLPGSQKNADSAFVRKDGTDGDERYLSNDYSVVTQG